MIRGGDVQMKKIGMLIMPCLCFLVSSVFAEEKIPDWLKRVEVSGEWETDKHPTMYFQTVQPLYQTLDEIDNVFIQPRVSLRAGDFSGNLGFGYRKLASENVLLGLNVFGDYADLHEHYRLGLGAEALSQILEVRLNGYFGVSSKRIVEETATSTTYEKVADGLDFELGLPIPYLPWLKFYTSGFFYDFSRFNDKVGWQNRLEAKFNDALRLEFYTWDDNKGEREYGSKLRCNIAFDKFADFKEILAFSTQPFPKKDLSEQILIPVEREYDIVVEKWTESPTVKIEIGRGT